MSSLEEYAEAKRSGLHKDTLKNWPDKPSDTIETEIPDRPAPMQVDFADTNDHRKWRDLLLAIQFLIILCLMGFAIYAFKHNKDINGTAQLLKEAPPKIIYKTKIKYKTSIKTQVKVKRVAYIPKEYRVARENLATAQERIKILMAAQRPGKWRERLCYGYADWGACLAYKVGIPFKARRGRFDL